MQSAFIYRPWLDLWLVNFCSKIWMWRVFYVLVFSMWSSSILSSLLQVQLFNNASNLQCSLRWKCDHGLRYELWTLCINTLGHYNLASRLMLHNLQHNTYHLLPILLFRLLNFKVCINNLYSSTTNGCPKAGSSCVLFAHFWWFRWNLESWANWKAQLFQQCFLFSLPHLCHCILLMIIVKI